MIKLISRVLLYVHVYVNFSTWNREKNIFILVIHINRNNRTKKCIIQSNNSLCTPSPEVKPALPLSCQFPKTFIHDPLHNDRGAGFGCTEICRLGSCRYHRTGTRSYLVDESNGLTGRTT